MTAFCDRRNSVFPLFRAVHLISVNLGVWQSFFNLLPLNAELSAYNTSSSTVNLPQNDFYFFGLQLQPTLVVNGSSDALSPYFRVNGGRGAVVSAYKRKNITYNFLCNSFIVISLLYISVHARQHCCCQNFKIYCLASLLFNFVQIIYCLISTAFHILLC